MHLFLFLQHRCNSVAAWLQQSAYGILINKLEAVYWSHRLFRILNNYV